MRFRNLAFLSLPVLAFTFSVGDFSLYAQSSQGILTGVARDSTSAVIAGATVTITDQDNGASRTVKTIADGAYRVDAIPPGRYTIKVTLSGFQTAETKDVLVAPSVVTSYDITLSVGSTTSEVVVEANQGVLDSDNGTLSGTVSAIELDKLPVFTLNPFELATTIPGVQFVSAGGFSNGFDVQVNGARPRANNFLLDGQEINDVGIGGQAFQPQIPDAFDTLTAFTSAASAEYGRGGGGVFNLVSKAGTNEFHGTGFERYSGSGLNANSGVNRQNGAKKTRYDQHTYGFTAGGPALKGKLFVFGGTQFQRYYGTVTPPALTLPDKAGYAQLQAIGGPQVALLDAYLLNGAYLQQTSLTTTPVSALNVGVQSNCPAGCNVTRGVFQRPAVAQTQPDTQWLYRIDLRPRDKDSLYGRYLHDRSSANPNFGNSGGTLPGFETQVGGPVELGQVGWTHVFNPQILNEFRASETRLNFQFQATAAAQANPVYQFPTITGIGFTATAIGPNQNFPQGRIEDLYQFQDTVAIQVGRQSIRLGADIGRQIEIDLVSQNAKGSLAYAATGVNSLTGNSYSTGLGNFLQNQTGQNGTITKAFGKTRVDSHLWRTGFFLEDDVKASADLTINLGVRYDYLGDPENSLPFPGIDINNPFALITPITSPTPGGPTAMATAIPVHKDFNNLSPRFGFAYTPHTGFFTNGKTVLRGGFGMFYDSTFSNILVNSTQSAPNGVSGQIPIITTGVGITNSTGQFANILPQLSLRSTVLSEDKNFANPYTYQYNLGVETEVPGQIVLAVRYVGSNGKKLFATNDFNYFTGTTGQRLDPTRGAITARGNYASSNYNGLEIDGTHNFSHGLLLRANYTFSHDLDNGSEVFALGSGSARAANLGPNGRSQEYGNSSYDHLQYFNVTYIWSPTGFKSGNAYTNAALGILTRHWTVSGNEQFQSGNYQNFQINGFDVNGDGNTANDRPLVTNRNAPLATGAIDGHFVGGMTGTYYDIASALNPVAGQKAILKVVSPGNQHFTIPYGPLGQYATQAVGRNAFLNPGTQNHNIALEKGIGLSYLHFDRGTLNLRAEVQDLGNHNNPGVLNSDIGTIGAPSFANPHLAKINDGRNLILWGKLIF